MSSGWKHKINENSQVSMREIWSSIAFISNMALNVPDKVLPSRTSRSSFWLYGCMAATDQRRLNRLMVQKPFWNYDRIWCMVPILWSI